MPFLKTCKDIISLTTARLSRDRGALLIFLFHAIFTNQAEIKLGHILPQQGITVEHFTRFVTYYRKSGYHFVSPDDVLQGLDKNGLYVMATFDDGYFNNTLALPIMEKYNVPALFFITSENIIHNKCYWWDIVYRQLRHRGQQKKQINRVMTKLKSKKHDEIEKFLLAEFGCQAFTPVSDVDRPMTPGELTHFASHPLVYIGNHTAHHAILTSYDQEGILAEIGECQNYLENLLGYKPKMISYPNGNYNQEIVAISEQIGFQLGITTEKRKNFLPLPENSAARLTLGRFTLWGSRSIETMCAIFRGNIRFNY